jgi:hypothetical protein
MNENNNELIMPLNGQLYAQYVVQEWNCNDCWKNIKWMTDQYTITQHILWLYQSVNALQENDTMILMSEFFFLLAQDGLPLDESYYKGGFIKAMNDAMNRGAKIFILFERFYLGGRDADGNCGYCTNIGTPFNCDIESNPPGTIPPLYNNYCWNGNQSIKYLRKNKNFIYYDITYVPEDNMTIHNHFKTISFLYKSTNRCSMYQGSWNLNTTIMGNKIEEAGFGYVCLLTEDFAQYHIYMLIQILLVMENYYSKYTLKSSVIMSQYIEKNYFLNKIPKLPIIIPQFLICGPHYCDSNFGCGAIGSTRQKYRSSTCTNNEQFITYIDYNVSFTFGIDPAPQNNEFQTDWNTKGYSKELIYGANLTSKLILSSKKFLKTYMASQFLEFSSCSTPDHLKNCPWSLEPTIESACHSILKNNIPWFALQNDGWQTAPTDSLIGQIMSNDIEKQNIYPKSMGFCGKETIKPLADPTKSGYAMTHTKIYINEKSVLFSSAHPVVSHYNSDLSNYDILIENSPGMVAFMNNHFNYVYNNCGIFAQNGSYKPVGIYKDGLPNKLYCNNNNETCCTTNLSNIYIKNSPLDSCQWPTKYNCVNNQCILTPSGTLSLLDCQKQCSIPKYNCVNNQCILSPSGTLSLLDCQKQCSIPKYNFVNNQCILSPSGTLSLLDCQKQIINKKSYSKSKYIILLFIILIILIIIIIIMIIFKKILYK